MIKQLLSLSLVIGKFYLAGKVLIWVYEKINNPEDNIPEEKIIMICELKERIQMLAEDSNCIPKCEFVFKNGEDARDGDDAESTGESTNKNRIISKLTERINIISLGTQAASNFNRSIR